MTLKDDLGLADEINGLLLSVSQSFAGLDGIGMCRGIGNGYTSFGNRNQPNGLILSVFSRAHAALSYRLAASCIGCFWGARSAQSTPRKRPQKLQLSTANLVDIVQARHKKPVTFGTRSEAESSKYLRSA